MRIKNNPFCAIIKPSPPPVTPISLPLPPSSFSHGTTYDVCSRCLDGTPDYLISCADSLQYCFPSVWDHDSITHSDSRRAITDCLSPAILLLTILTKKRSRSREYTRDDASYRAMNCTLDIQHNRPAWQPHHTNAKGHIWSCSRIDSL